MTLCSSTASVLRPLQAMMLALALSACASDEYFDYSADGLRVEHVKGATCSSPRALIYLLDSPDGAYMYMSSHAAFPLDADLFVRVTAEQPLRFTSPVFVVTSLEDNMTYKLALQQFGGGGRLVDPTESLSHDYPKGESHYGSDLGLNEFPKLRRFTIQLPPVEVGGKVVVLPIIKAERKTETYFTGLCLR